MEGRIVFKNGKSLEISTSDDTKGVSILKSLQLKYTSLNQDFYNRLKKFGRVKVIREPVVTSSRRFLDKGVIKTLLLMVYLKFLYFLRMNDNRLKSLMEDYNLLNIDVTNMTIIKRKNHESKNR